MVIPLCNPDKAALAYVDGKEGENNSFLIESNVYATGTDGDNQYQTIKGDLAKAIAPNEAAAWLKMHNGCLVLTDASFYIWCRLRLVVMEHWYSTHILRLKMMIW